MKFWFAPLNLQILVDNILEDSCHAFISFAWHQAHDNCADSINIGNEDILHVSIGLYWEIAGKVAVDRPSTESARTAKQNTLLPMAVHI